MEKLQELARRCGEEAVVVKNMVLLAGGILSHNFLDEGVVGDFFSTSPVEEIDEVLGPLPEDVLEMLEIQDYYELEEWLFENKKLGFLIEVCTPQFLHDGTPGSHWSYSFSSCYLKWCYGDTLEAAIEKGFAWVAWLRVEERRRREDLVGALAEVGVS